MTVAHANYSQGAQRPDLRVVRGTFDGFATLKVARSRERLRFYRDNPGQLWGLSWGYTELNELTDGIGPEDAVFLGARPGMGKTWVACNLALVQMQAGKRVAFFALEMSEDAIAMRMASLTSGIPLSALRKGRIFDRSTQTWLPTPVEWYDRFDDALVAIEEQRLLGIKSGALSSGEMRTIVQKLKEHDKAPALVVVDHVGLCTDRGGSPYERVTNAVVGLAASARELKVPHLVLTHVKRDVSGRDDKRPAMTDFADTGAIEKNATVLMYIHRDSAYARLGEQPEVDEMELGVLKNREGGSGVGHVTYYPLTGRMVDKVQPAEVDLGVY